MHSHGGVQAIERVLPALEGVLRHAVAAHRGGILPWVQACELPVRVLHVEGYSLRLCDQAFTGRQRGTQSLNHIEVQLRQIARLVHQHLRFVLELADLVVDLLQRAGCGVSVLHQVQRIHKGPRGSGLHGQQTGCQHGGQGCG
ncbi:hypothetical protein D3C71_1622360 [compost metagenome]